MAGIEEKELGLYVIKTMQGDFRKECTEDAARGRAAQLGGAAPFVAIVATNVERYSR